MCYLCSTAWRLSQSKPPINCKNKTIFIIMKANNVFINPLTDFGFKKVFCTTERGSRRLTSFLRAFLPDIMRDVVSITFRPTEILGEREAEKKVVFDIYCVTDTGRHFIIEMQRAEQSFFSNRILTYSSRVVSGEVMRGDMEYNIPTVISFNIMDYDSNEFSHYEDAFHIVKLKDEKNAVYSEKTVFCFLELTKFAAQNIGQMKDVVFKDEGMKWAFILENMHKMGEQDLSGEDEMFQQMFEDCRISKLTTMEKKAYKKSILDYADVRDAVKVAQKRGEERGYEQGVQQGVQQGIQQGKEEGKEEALIQTAQNLLELGLPLADVAKATGLSEEKILANMGNAVN